MRPITTSIKKGKGEILEPVTSRDFSGGWNVLDDDLNLARKFSTRLYNCSYTVSGQIAIRFGTRLFAIPGSLTTTPSGMINAVYFKTAIVCVMSNGEIVAVQGDGTMTRIWDAIIAGALPGGPAPWSTTDFASFAIFHGELIIANGVDKPLIVRANYDVEYLHDEGTGSNINTPIARYLAVCNRYLVMSGDPVNPDRIHISARDTSGTFYGDPAPNDGTFVDIGSVLASSSGIRGIVNFRDRLVVAYAEGTVLGVLGVYDTAGTTHKPNFDDAVDQYGAVSHRTLVSYGDDMLMMDSVGVPSLKRTVFTGTIKPDRVSDLVDPEMATAIGVLSNTGQEDHTFGVYNQREGQFMFFVPNHSVLDDITETKAYVFSFRPSLRVAAWCRFDGWNFTCGLRTAENNVFFGDKDGKLWLYGSERSPAYADYIGDIDHEGDDGVAIDFDWELPWSDFSLRMNTKTTKYIALDTRGTGEFNVAMYTDRFLVDVDNVDAPLLTMQMVGGDTPTFGAGDQPYGGGRNTSDEYMWAWPAKFIFAKLRFRGSIREPLAFVSFSLLFQKGKYNR